MQILNNLKRSFTLTREALIYIKKISEDIQESSKGSKKKKKNQTVIGML